MRNKPPQFQFLIDPKIERSLGRYIYELRDPRNDEVFYVGQGKKQRVNDHFASSAQMSRKPGGMSDKESLICDIWAENLSVIVNVLRRNLPNDKTSDHVEGGIIASRGLSPGGPLLNKNRGLLLDKHGRLGLQELKDRAASYIDPGRPFERVFVFNIENGLRERDDVYEATRRAWKVNEVNRHNSAYAVGLERGISRGAFVVERWDRYDDKWAFVGTVTREVEPLLEKNWKRITERTGYWNQGGYLIVEFNGRGRFRYHRGSRDQQSWHSLR